MDSELLIHSLEMLGQPVAQAVLLALGLGILSLELHLPGTHLPSALGGLILLLTVTMGWWHGQVAIWELAVLATGLLLLALEVLVIPGFGLAGFAGIALILASVFLALLPPAPAQTDVERAIVAMLLCLLVVGGSVVRARPWRGDHPAGPLVLNERLDGKAHGPADLHLVGRRARVVSDCRPSGRVELEGRVHPAITRGEFLERGASVVIRTTRGAELEVEAAPQTAEPEDNTHP